MKNTKIIFVLGGLFSGIGKGVVASSLAKLLKLNQLKVSVQKQDPYLNVDCHLMNPAEHGEVFVTKDGLEADLDLGNYERFLNQKITRLSSVTSGQIYQSVLKKERNQKYAGKTVNIYDVSQEIQQKIFNIIDQEKPDCLVVELGGTIGDNDSTPFLISAAQIQRKLGNKNVAFVFLTYVSYFNNLGQFKTKPTQNSIALLRANAIEPNFVILRSDRVVSEKIKTKIAKFCYLTNEQIFSLPDTNIYKIPLLLFSEGLIKKILDFFKLPENIDEKKLLFLSNKINILSQSTQKIKIAIVNKYPNFKQSYLSFYEALYAAALNTNINFEYQEINPETLSSDNLKDVLESFDAIVVPGGFGVRGVEGKLLAIEFARENKIPFFGICLGFQLALIEFARNILNLKNATSEEFASDSKVPLIIKYFDSINHKMFLGEQEIMIDTNSLVFRFYQKEKILGRHRHRLVFNKKYQRNFEKEGFVFSGVANDENKIIEIIELKNHPFFFATQFHIE